MLVKCPETEVSTVSSIVLVLVCRKTEADGHWVDQSALIKMGFKLSYWSAEWLSASVFSANKEQHSVSDGPWTDTLKITICQSTVSKYSSDVFWIKLFQHTQKIQNNVFLRPFFSQFLESIFCGPTGNPVLDLYSCNLIHQPLTMTHVPMETNVHCTEQYSPSFLCTI